MHKLNNKNIKTYLFFVFILTGLFSNAFSQIKKKEIFHDSENLKEEIISSISAYFDGISQIGFSGTVLIGDKDDILFHSGYGLADKETGRKIDPGTIFTTGSITKVFTAVLIQKMATEGLLKLNDPIYRYLESVPVNKKGITLHHLLTHTSGLKRNGLKGGDTNLDATRNAVLKNVFDSELLFEPGSQQEYSNIGYTLLAIIAENVSKKSYEDLLYENILKPSSMFQTGYLIPKYTESQLAKGYRGQKEIPAIINLPQLSDGVTWNLRGNGGLHSNLNDMYRFYISLQNESIITIKTLNAMIGQPIQNVYPNKYYGIGFEILNENGLRDLTHSGGNGYFLADFHWLIDEGLMFYIATNNGELNISQISRNVKNILRGQNINLPSKIEQIDTNKLRNYAGKYKFDFGDTLKITLKDKHLEVSADSKKSIAVIYGIENQKSNKIVGEEAINSKKILEQEFIGNFEPKFLAMDKSSTIETLKKYHGYDANYWKDNFGKYKNIEIIGVAGDNQFVSVLLKINFERGAAAENYIWRNGILSNIAVYANWKDFEFILTFYPLSSNKFQAFSINNPIISELEFIYNRKTEKVYELIINGQRAKRIRQ